MPTLSAWHLVLGFMYSAASITLLSLVFDRPAPQKVGARSEFGGHYEVRDGVLRWCEQ